MKGLKYVDVDQIVKLNLHPDDFIVIKSPQDRWNDIRLALTQLHFPYSVPVLFLLPDEDVHRLSKDRAEQIAKEITHRFDSMPNP